MKRYLYIIAIAIIGSTLQVKSQDLIARPASVDKKAKQTEVMQSNNKAVPQAKTPNAAKTRTTVKTASHLKFMGIPIDGTLEEFAPRLIEKNFSQDKHAPHCFSGSFYETYSSVYVHTDKATDIINSVEVRYFSGVNGLSDDQMVSLYNRIVRGLKKKYSSAKFSKLDGKTLLSMPLGYIYCEIYGRNLPKNFGGGTYIELHYVDKKNTSAYSLPRLNRADDDL